MTNLIINIFVSNRMLPVLQDELYKVAGKAGGKYGKSPEEDIDGPIKEPRSFWLDAICRIHDVIEQIDTTRQMSEERKLNNCELAMDFGNGDYDFEAFLKVELAAIAGRLAKEAWSEYSPALRQEILSQGPFIAAQMRDQVVEYRQPKLFKDVVEGPKKPVDVRVMSLG
ncbi:MAG: hypothetical protein KDJ65_38750 [Anaerolineae bacterium]|nr:hypothetical protein [Anaerolineae bacterium]